MQTFGSDLTVDVGGSINLSGFTIYSTPDPGNLLLIAGQDITIGDNAQVVANGTMNSSLTLVVDNAFPTAPGVGPGQFLLDTTGLICAGPICSGGMQTPVRIYTAARPQNTINNAIDGMPFIPGPFAVDTPTEQWGIYYPGGVYGGVAFTIYYKEPQAIPPVPPAPPPPVPPPTPSTTITANFSQLPSLLPSLQPPRIPYVFPNYHFQVCMRTKRASFCDPTFSPYGSFIFEDDVYWIGASF